MGRHSPGRFLKIPRPEFPLPPDDARAGGCGIIKAAGDQLDAFPQYVLNGIGFFHDLGEGIEACQFLVAFLQFFLRGPALRHFPLQTLLRGVEFPGSFPDPVLQAIPAYPQLRGHFVERPGKLPQFPAGGLRDLLAEMVGAGRDRFRLVAEHGDR